MITTTKIKTIARDYKETNHDDTKPYAYVAPSKYQHLLDEKYQRVGDCEEEEDEGMAADCAAANADDDEYYNYNDVYGNPWDGDYPEEEEMPNPTSKKYAISFVMFEEAKQHHKTKTGIMLNELKAMNEARQGHSTKFATLMEETHKSTFRYKNLQHLREGDPTDYPCYDDPGGMDTMRTRSYNVLIREAHAAKDEDLAAFISSYGGTGYERAFVDWQIKTYLQNRLKIQQQMARVQEKQARRRIRQKGKQIQTTMTEVAQDTPVQYRHDQLEATVARTTKVVTFTTHDKWHSHDDKGTTTHQQERRQQALTGEQWREQQKQRQEQEQSQRRKEQRRQLEAEKQSQIEQKEEMQREWWQCMRDEYDDQLKTQQIEEEWQRSEAEKHQQTMAMKRHEEARALEAQQLQQMQCIQEKEEARSRQMEEISRHTMERQRQAEALEAEATQRIKEAQIQEEQRSKQVLQEGHERLMAQRFQYQEALRSEEAEMRRQQNIKKKKTEVVITAH
jgi:hypothetical protein